jgi:hypothetical protein
MVRTGKQDVTLPNLRTAAKFVNAIFPMGTYLRFHLPHHMQRGNLFGHSQIKCKSILVIFYLLMNQSRSWRIACRIIVKFGCALLVALPIVAFPCQHYLEKSHYGYGITTTATSMVKVTFARAGNQRTSSDSELAS